MSNHLPKMRKSSEYAPGPKSWSGSNGRATSIGAGNYYPLVGGESGKSEVSWFLTLSSAEDAAEEIKVAVLMSRRRGADSAIGRMGPPKIRGGGIDLTHRFDSQNIGTCRVRLNAQSAKLDIIQCDLAPVEGRPEARWRRPGKAEEGTET